MRLLTVFLFGIVLHVSAMTSAQNVSFTFELKNASFEDLIREIRRNSDFYFIYKNSEVSQVGSLNKKFTNVNIQNVLSECLSNTGLAYSIENNLILICRQERQIQDSTVKVKEILVKGIVKDKKGIPLPGVTVVIKGTNIGVATDVKGRFKLMLPETIKDPYLVVSFIGMEKQELRVSNEDMNIIMKESVNEIEEVVVRTGYENIDKRRLTSSVVTVKMDDIMEPITGTLDKMLQGKIPGMAVLQQSSTVGAAPKIRIRGSSSILGNREPLWVLDGIILDDPIPLDVTELNSMDRVNLIGNAISGLNPEDIDQIDILKDASATALYGIKAANGVIMITTKRGKFGPPSIRYSTSMGFTQRPTINKMHIMNSKDRIEVSEEMFERGLEFTDMGAVGSVGYEGLLIQLANNKISYSEFTKRVKQLKEQNTDWYKELFRNSFSQSHTISVSGANEKINYYFSVGYSDMQGSTLQESSKRYNFTTSLDIKLSEKMNMSLNLGVANGKTQRPHSSIDLYKYAYTTSRAIAPYDENGEYNYYAIKSGFDSFPIITTPDLTYNIFNELNTTRQGQSSLSVNSRLNLGYKVTSSLRVSGLFAYNVTSSNGKSWAAEDSYFISTKRKLVYGYPLLKPDYESFGNNCELPFGGVLNTSSNRNTSYSGRLDVTFNKNFDIHSLNLMAGVEMRSSENQGVSSTFWGYLPDRGEKFVYNDPKEWPRHNELLKKHQPTVSNSKQNTMSYFASFSYAYDNRYILNANVRGDASNKLGQDKSARFLPIWSFSGRWNVSDERFMENALWIEGLNLHGSYGLQGNVTDAHNPNMIVLIGTLDEVTQQYENTLHSLPNRNLLWEKTRTINLGTDFSFFNGRLAAMFEYYKKKSVDQLVSTSVESTNGATTVTMNHGNLTNKGWEMSFSGTPIKTKNVTWNLSFNTSKSKNEVVNAGEIRVPSVEEYLEGSLIRNGYAVNSFYSYRFDQINDKGEPVFLGIKAKDADDNVLINTREEAFEQGLVYSGRREPNFTGGLSTSLRVKNFSLNASFSMQFGSKIRLNNLYTEDLRLPFPAQNMTDEFVNRWRKPGDEKHTNIPRLTDDSSYPKGIFIDKSGSAPLGSNIYNFYNYSDLRVVSGNFMRCRNISLSYFFPAEWLSHIYVKNATMGLSVSNPFVIKSKSLKGRDPEQISLGGGAIPPQASYSFNFSVSF